MNALDFVRGQGLDAVLTLATSGLSVSDDDILCVYFQRPGTDICHQVVHMVGDALVLKSADIHGLSLNKVHNKGLFDADFGKELALMLDGTKVAVYNPSFIASFLGKYVPCGRLRLYDLPYLYWRASAGTVPFDTVMEDALWNEGKGRSKISFAGALALSGVSVGEDPTVEPGYLKCKALSDMFLSLGNLQEGS